MTDLYRFKTSEVAFIHLFAAMANRDMCQDCAGSGREVIYINGEAEFSSCNCSAYVQKVLYQGEVLFFESIERIMTANNDHLPGCLQDVLQIVSNIFLPRNYNFSRVVFQDYYEVDVTHQGKVTTYKGSSLYLAAKEAISETCKGFTNA